MGVFDGVKNVENFTKRIEGEVTLEFTGVVERSVKADSRKRMVIFEYAYIGPDEFFENETVTEMFIYFTEMDEAMYKNFTDDEVANAKKSVQRMCERMIELGAPREAVNKGTADPEKLEGTVVKTNIWYNKSNFLQINKCRIVPKKAAEKPSAKSGTSISDLLNTGKDAK